MAGRRKKGEAFESECIAVASRFELSFLGPCNTPLPRGEESRVRDLIGDLHPINLTYLTEKENSEKLQVCATLQSGRA